MFTKWLLGSPGPINATEALIQEVVNVKKTMIATLAALMLAGALSAVGGTTSVSSATTVIVIGEGSAPLPLALPPGDTNSDSTSLTTKF